MELVVKNLSAKAEDIETWVQALGWGDPLEEGMATHSSILAWRIPWTEEPGGLRFIGLQRIEHDWSDLAHVHTFYTLATLYISYIALFHKHLLNVCVPAKMMNSKLYLSRDVLIINVLHSIRHKVGTCYILIEWMNEYS